MQLLALRVPLVIAQVTCELKGPVADQHCEQAAEEHPDLVVAELHATDPRMTPPPWATSRRWSRSTGGRVCRRGRAPTLEQRPLTPGLGRPSVHRLGIA